MYHGKDMDLISSYPQLVGSAHYLHAQIWIIDRQGKIVVDSDQSERTGRVIDRFDPTAAGNKSYTIGTFYDQFTYDVLSVHAPITGNYTTYGYVVIHMPLLSLIHICSIFHCVESDFFNSICISENASQSFPNSLSE